MLAFAGMRSCGAIDNLDTEIRRLASEIRAVEQMLVQSCGLPPVTAGKTPSSSWAGKLRSLRQRVGLSVARFAGSQAMLAVSTPQPD